jgi:DNA polymerase III subunit delta
MKIKEVVNNLRNNTFYNSYYLKGNDQFLQNFFIQKSLHFIFKDNPYDKTLMNPGDMNEKKIIDQILITDLFKSNKLFILRDPQKLKSKTFEDLLKYLNNPHENHLLIIINDDWSKKSTYLNKIERHLSYIDVQTPHESELKKWIVYLFKLRNKEVSIKVVNTLIEMAGDSLNHIDNEIEKVCLFVKNHKHISYENLKQFSGWKKERNRWELLMAIGEKNFDKSIFLANRILSNGDSMISLIYPLTAFLQEILYAKMNKGTNLVYRGYTPIPNKVKMNITSFKNLFSIKELENGLSELCNIDKRQKTKHSTDEADLVQFIGAFVGS